MKKIFLSLIGVTLLTACSVKNLQKKGKTSLDSFNIQVPFTMNSELIEIKAMVNGEAKNMIFDTGADLSLIAQEKPTGKITEVEGAANKSIKLGQDKVASISIGDVSFENTFAVNGKLEGIEQKMEDFGGIIGQPIIAKANWLFDFDTKMMTLSNQTINHDGFTAIKIDRKKGRPYTTLSVDGIEYNAIIDLGSSSSLSIPENHPLAQKLIAELDFTTSVDQVFTISGLRDVTKQTSSLSKLQLGDIEMTDVEVTILKSSQIRIGLAMFKDYQLLIDSDQQVYRIK